MCFDFPRVCYVPSKSRRLSLLLSTSHINLEDHRVSANQQSPTTEKDKTLTYVKLLSRGTQTKPMKNKCQILLLQEALRCHQLILFSHPIRPNNLLKTELYETLQLVEMISIITINEHNKKTAEKKGTKIHPM